MKIYEKKECPECKKKILMLVKIAQMEMELDTVPPKNNPYCKESYEKKV